MKSFFDRRDPLTGLLNRHGFGKELERGIARIGRYGRRLAVLWIDLLGLDELEERTNRETADNRRIEAAVRLSELIRRVDTIARLDRNSFGVLKTDFEGPEHVAVLAQRLLAAVSSEPSDDGWIAAAQIGISVFPPGDAEPETLLRRAELALQTRSADPPAVGKNRYLFYDEEIGREVEHRIQLLGDLRKALEKGDLGLVYQPQIDSRDGQIIGVEAFVRWHRHPRESIPPAQLLSLASANALMPGVGQRVMELACHQAATWRHQKLPAVPLAVNLSAAELRSEDLLDRVHKTLNTTGLPPKALEFEFTEESLGTGRRALDRVLQQLHGLGFRLTLDNFGIGPSSLEELTRLPLDKLKIDQSFVQGLPNDPRALAVVRSALGLAHTLELQVVAEGVETAEQLECLQAEGCFEVQGYYLGRPMAADELTALLFEKS